MAVKIAYRLQCTAGLGGHASVAVQVAGQCRGPGWGTSMPHRTAASTVDPETGLSVAVQLPLVPRACQQVVWPAPAGAAAASCRPSSLAGPPPSNRRRCPPARVPAGVGLSESHYAVIRSVANLPSKQVLPYNPTPAPHAVHAWGSAPHQQGCQHVWLG